MAELSKISCNSCGAELIFNPASQKTLCNFCGSEFEIEQADGAGEIMLPDGVLPFTVNQDGFKTRVLEWLSEGDYTPDDILTSSVFEEYSGVYLPMHFFSGQYAGNWSASSGYNRTERYVGRDINGKPVTKTRIVTDWRPSSGSVGGKYDILCYAGDEVKGDQGTSITNFAEATSFERGQMKKFDAKYTLGSSLLEFKLQDDDVWHDRGEAKMNLIGMADIQGRIPGDKYKDLHYDLSHDHKAVTKVYIPSWIACYKYKDEKFYVTLDGANANRVGDLPRPEDQARKDRVKKFFYPGHAGLFIFVACLITGVSLGERHDLYDATIVGGQVGIFIAAAGYITAGIRRWWELKKSREKRQEILQRVKSGQTVNPEPQAEAPQVEEPQAEEPKE